MQELTVDWFQNIFLIFGENMEENVIITDPFYLDKFMEIQRQNVVLSNKLRDIFEDTHTRNIIVSQFGQDFFDVLKDTPA